MARYLRGAELEVLSRSRLIEGIQVGPNNYATAPGFWLRARDGRGRTGWMASFTVFPVGVWPNGPWAVALALPVGDGSPWVMLSATESFVGGTPSQNGPEDVETSPQPPFPGWARQATSMDFEGRARKLQVRDTQPHQEACWYGASLGPTVRRGDLLPGHRIAILGPGTFGGNAPVARIVDRPAQPLSREEIAAALQSDAALFELAARGAFSAQCEPPLTIDLGLDGILEELHTCRLETADHELDLALGTTTATGPRHAWLVRMTVHGSPWNGKPHPPNGLNVLPTASQPWFVSDLNQDGITELWLGAHVVPEQSDGKFEGWEVYFVHGSQAFGPWYAFGGGAGC